MFVYVLKLFMWNVPGEVNRNINSWSVTDTFHKCNLLIISNSKNPMGLDPMNEMSRYLQK